MQTDVIVEYHKLRPRQVVERREACPVAYLGLGTLEWHGFHNPLGVDGLKAHGVACYLARRIGGVAMPPLYWGDDRGVLAEVAFDPAQVAGKDWFPKGMDDQTVKIAAGMKLSKQAFLAEAERCDRNGGSRLWQELVEHMLFQIEASGFKLIVVYPGHGGFWTTPASTAVESYRRNGGRAPVRVIRETDYSKYEDLCHGCVDHAGTLETSMIMALYPALVDLGELNPNDRFHVGVTGPSPFAATPALGQAILDEFEAIVRAEIDEYAKE